MWPVRLAGLSSSDEPRRAAGLNAGVTNSRSLTHSRAGGMMCACRGTRVGQAVRPPGRSCKATGRGTRRPNWRSGDVYTLRVFASGSRIDRCPRCGAPPTSSSPSNASPYLSTAATGMPALSIELSPGRTRPTGRRSWHATSPVTLTPPRGCRALDGPFSDSGSTKIPSDVAAAVAAAVRGSGSD